MKNSWLDHMRNSVNNHEESVPDDLWNDIEKELFSEEKDQIIPLVETTQSKGVASMNSEKQFFWKRCAAVILLLLSAGGIYWLGFNDDSTHSRTASNKLNNQIVEKVNNINSIENGVVEVDHDDLVIPKYGDPRNNKSDRTQLTTIDSYQSQINHNNQNSLALSQVDVKRSQELELNKDKTTIELFTESSSNNIVEQKDIEITDDEKSKVDNKALIASLEKEIEDIKKKNTTDIQKKWLIGVETSGLAMAANEDLKGFYTISGTRLSLDENLMGVYQLWQTPVTDIMLINRQKESVTDIKHKNPISYGAKVQYQLSNKIGLSAGVQYTKLVSELKSGTSEDYLYTQQVIKYVGIPVQVNYSFLNTNKWSTYAGLGGQVDQPIDGFQKMSFVKNTELQEVENKKVEDLKMQLSATAGVGIQYKMTPRLGLYAEPNVVYYFDNKSTVGSIFKEKPLNFSLRFGLQWNLSK